ncbi:alpha/beta fold hydrolase [Cereibacter azotoformans]|uniref:Polyhydroxyalkanoate synthase n=1 Tax=Cereibacter azotoformans TaxID=43057 RepID=A0A2T5K8B2_9RHOB|nr:alpha/beta fold hydrolase [Cereibacter azotoformans]AXQ94921.1 alpha/beta fold hydrolase [Cereibacter sphaeroides]MBO4170207.1 alpha/beta fold hydrolase [Cereibacter azotoformans]PTR18664.1 polyhydroxyalkanoate synthase [Cereibacter azotoformans]UIJ30499.1 alpha/beta fold hydrolase [Cereibacter azotoformans]
MSDMKWNAEGVPTYGQALDRAARATIAGMTRGLAPSVLATATLDWMMHLAAAPGKQAELWEKAARSATAIMEGGLHAHEAPVKDRRFATEAWSRQPFAALRDSFLLTEDWWQAATTGLRGMDRAHEAALSFSVRQILDVWSPSNVPFFNPEILTRTAETGGANLIQGAVNFTGDMMQLATGAPMETGDYRVGENLAVTPGKVVARTHLMELIQYTPTTRQVHPEPVLIVPAWIMKYYILDLTEQNSLVRWLVAQGFTVFMISWRNPGPEDRDLGLVDYIDQGPRAALKAIQAITGAPKVHAAGYCLGGTLLSIMAAQMARDHDERLASMTLFAAQVDFSEAGELALFISEAQVALLEDMMWHQGYLDSDQMSGAFTLLRSNDLIWSRMIHEYLMGERPHPNDLMTWNADSTRMPYRMHSEYLRQLFLENRFAEGKFELEGHTLSLTELRVPILAVGTETDHVAPWRSVFKIQRLTETETTFILTSGGHNAGIVSEPGHPRRHFRIATTQRDDPYKDADEWFAAHASVEGSWWPAWGAWLAERSSAKAKLPPMGSASAGYPPLCDAPGAYILQR